MVIWGISANSHDAAITVVHDNNIVFASQSERYSKKKNDMHLHHELIANARKYGEPDVVIWYERPLLKTVRQLFAGQGWKWNENNIKKYLASYGIDAPIKYVSHHKSHAAGGYFTSPFNEAAVLVIDAIGEFDTTTIWKAKNKRLSKKLTIGYPHSLGLWYSAMTQRVGLKPNEEEYILMGMAAYGNPTKYSLDILEDFFQTEESIHPNEMFPDDTLLKLKQSVHRGCPWWKPELKQQQDMYDIAASTQFVYELYFHALLQRTQELTNSKNLVLSGGCALNCVANEIALLYFDNVWIMPNPGDAGNSLGAVAAYTNNFLQWEHPYLGYEIEGEYPVEQALQELLTNKMVGVASGKAEFGPRALGNRSLLADPRGPDMKDRVNKIKKRQKFRPFAPAILEERASEYFHMPTEKIPYMQFTAVCKRPEEFPAIIHADGTSRVQTVSEKDNPGFYQLLKRWEQETGCPMLLNTSLNIKGQPIVNDEIDAAKFQKKYKVKVVTRA
jgi:carbamoyltransferase